MPRGVLHVLVGAVCEARFGVVAAFERKIARRAAVEVREVAVGVPLGVEIERWLAARKRDDPEGRWEAWKHFHAEDMTNFADVSRGRLAWTSLSTPTTPRSWGWTT
jgi:hypothetical protein